MLYFLNFHTESKHCHLASYGHTLCVALNGISFVRVPGVLSSGKVLLLQS